MSYRYEAPFRKPYELVAVATWAVALIVAAMMAQLGKQPFWALSGACGVAAAMLLWRLWPALKLRDRLKRLEGRPLSFITLSAMLDRLRGRPGMVWLGEGFAWGQKEAQRLYDLTRADESVLSPYVEGQMGKRWLHGMCDQEDNINVPVEHFAGHVMIVGTTGSGKTRLLDHLISQAIARNESVIVLDPKGDRDLCDAMRRTCVALGQGQRFKYFHPAFPRISVRLDPMKNFNRATELATRVAALIRGDGVDPWSAFSQQALKSIIEGLLIVNAKPNLIDLRRFIEGGPSALLVRAFEAHFTKMIPAWRELAQAYTAKASGDKRGASVEDRQALAYVAFYRASVSRNPAVTNLAIEGLVGQFEHDRSHYGKMVASLIPMLHMLTSGEIGPLLSPDAEDYADTREITDLARIIKNRQVLYIGLDNLSDVMVGTAIGALFACDLAAVAGDRYNYGDRSMTRDDQIPAQIFVDEASFIPPPFVEILNKGRGALLRCTVASQLLSDWAVALGSMERARQVLGNTNNLICLRSLDGQTQEFVCESFPKVFVRKVEHSQSISTSSEAPAIFSGATSEKLAEEEVYLVPPAMLGSLPNLEFFARVSGGRVYKGIIPILNKDAA